MSKNDLEAFFPLAHHLQWLNLEYQNRTFQKRILQLQQKPMNAKEHHEKLWRDITKIMTRTQFSTVNNKLYQHGSRYSNKQIVFTQIFITKNFTVCSRTDDFWFYIPIWKQLFQFLRAHFCQMLLSQVLVHLRKSTFGIRKTKEAKLKEITLFHPDKRFLGIKFILWWTNWQHQIVQMNEEIHFPLSLSHKKDELIECTS